MAKEYYDTITCPQCKKVTPVAEHCIHCGAQLAEEGQLIESGFCPSCGMYTPFGKYCGACGKPMPKKEGT